MGSELSSLLNRATSLDVTQAPSTSRDDIKGLSHNLVFVNHKHPEGDRQLGSDASDTASSSKQNSGEAALIVSIFYYLRRQEYTTEQIVILTPYLRQVQVLQETFRKYRTEACWDSLDSKELVESGYLSQTKYGFEQEPRVATIGMSQQKNAICYY